MNEDSFFFLTKSCKSVVVKCGGGGVKECVNHVPAMSPPPGSYDCDKASSQN